LISVAEQYGLEVDPEAFVWQLDVGQRQRVEIVKVLLSGAQVLLFDEPTSVLAITEVGAFIKMIGQLRDEGYGILFVTHKLQEALACADRVTVLRGGRVAFTSTAVKELDGKTLVTHMIGKWITPLPVVRAAPPEGQTFLQATNLAVADDHGRVILQEANLKLRPGELVGVAGISGNGQRELAEALLGLRPVRSGQLSVKGQDFTHASPNRFLEAGVVGIPEDPLEEAVVPGLSVLEHMILGGLPERRRGLSIHWPDVQADFAQLPEVAVLQVPAPGRRADRLSGGNLQRLVLTRALAHQPSVLIACYPSRGLDIATTRAIQNLLLNRRDAGTAILLFSEDLSELYELSDTLVVLTHGQLLGPIDPRSTHAYEVAQWMTSPDSYHQRSPAQSPASEDQLELPFQPEHEHLPSPALSLNLSEHA
jgi:general nucleoside transport system ATP-binding protein